MFYRVYECILQMLILALGLFILVLVCGWCTNEVTTFSLLTQGGIAGLILCGLYRLCFGNNGKFLSSSNTKKATPPLHKPAA